jgi:NitT/TauT family transport system substrate-binding protein
MIFSGAGCGHAFARRALLLRCIKHSSHKLRRERRTGKIAPGWTIFGDINMKRILALAAMTAALASSFAFAQAPEKKDVHISVGGKPALYYLPLTIAEQLGYFKDEGLNVKISDFAGGSQSLQAVVGGSADVVSGAFEHTINMQAKKISMIAFVQMGRAPQISIGISKAKAATYKGPADLKGLKFGVSAPGSSTNIILNAFIAKGGLKPNEVAIVGVGTGAGAIAAVKSGQIDGTSNTDPVMTKLELDGAVKIIADARTMKGTEAIFGGPLPNG